MIKQNFLYLLLASALLGFSVASNATECLTQGAWAGTIGKIPMTMEFQVVSIYSSSEKSEQINGRYYYKNNLSDLILKQNNTNNGWNEYGTSNQITGHISAYKCEGNLLTAQWQSADKKIILPLVANRVPDYSKQRLGNIQFSVTPKVFNHRQYQTISLPNIKSTSLLLVGKSESIEKINQRLKDIYIGQVEDEISCLSYGRMENRDFESENTYSIIDWNSAYLTISNTSIYDCGGAHPNYGESKSVYNLKTGNLENTSLWLNEAYQTKYHEIEKETALGELLSSAYLKQRLSTGDKPDDAESCLDSINFYNASLWTNGKKLFFKSDASHANTPCIEEVALTYKQVKPFLSIAGKSAFQASIQK